MDGRLERAWPSAETAASKMRYQMNRLRRLAANFQMQKETSLGRHAQAIGQALYPGAVLQERVLGAAYYFATLRLRTGGGDHLPSGWILHWTYGNVAVARAFSLSP